MRSDYLNLLVTGAVALSLGAIVAPTAQAAGMKVSGTFTGSCRQQEPRPLAEANVLVGQICTATNASPGAPLDGATVLFTQIVILDKGNGPQIGQNAVIDKAGSITSEYRGTIKTTMVDGAPRTGGSGSYRMVHGTGAYEGGNGQGTYDLVFTSPTEFISHWSGEMTLPSKEAAR